MSGGVMKEYLIGVINSQFLINMMREVAMSHICAIDLMKIKDDVSQ